MSLYLLHIEPPYEHAGHYLGWTNNVPRRVMEHVSGGPKASPLIRAALAAGHSVALVRVMEGDRRAERRIKVRSHVPRICPVCYGRTLRKDRQPHVAAPVSA